MLLLGVLQTLAEVATFQEILISLNSTPIRYILITVAEFIASNSTILYSYTYDQFDKNESLRLRWFLTHCDRIDRSP